MIQYATPAELAHHIDPDAPTPTPPPLATVLLRTASGLVRGATAGAVYSTDAEGVPTAPHIAAAFRDATCEQAAAWSLHGIDPRKGRASAQRTIASKSLLGGSVSYAADTRADQARSDLASGETLTDAAWQILRQAGLTTSSIQTAGYGVLVDTSETRAYDPTSGRFIE